MTLNDLPNLETLSIFILSSRVPTNLIGPSDCGLKNKLLLSLYIAVVPVLLHTAI